MLRFSIDSFNLSVITCEILFSLKLKKSFQRLEVFINMMMDKEEDNLTDFIVETMSGRKKNDPIYPGHYDSLLNGLDISFYCPK
jgi:hypothetical protein